MDLDKLLADDTTVSKETVKATAEIAKEKLSENPVKKKETRGRKKGGKEMTKQDRIIVWILIALTVLMGIPNWIELLTR